MEIDDFEAVILADGAFPAHELPLRVLESGKPVVCCDGAANTMVARGLMPDCVVGDLDSIMPEVAARLKDRMHRVAEQDTNDLAKAYRFCIKRGWSRLAILGISGNREDHTLGNLSYLVDFAKKAKINAYTDTGVFTPLLRSCVLRSHEGQAVSLFSFERNLNVYSRGLRYSLSGVKFDRWWNATLNVATGDEITLTFDGGPLLVFRSYC